MAIVEIGGRALGKNTGWLRGGYRLKWGCRPAHQQLCFVPLVIIFPGTRQPRCKSQEGEYGLTYLGRCCQRTEGKTVDSRKWLKMAHGFDGVKEQMLQGWKWERQKAVRWSMKAGGVNLWFQRWSGIRWWYIKGVWSMVEMRSPGGGDSELFRFGVVYPHWW